MWTRTLAPSSMGKHENPCSRSPPSPPFPPPLLIDPNHGVVQFLELVRLPYFDSCNFPSRRTGYVLYFGTSHCILSSYTNDPPLPHGSPSFSSSLKSHPEATETHHPVLFESSSSFFIFVFYFRPGSLFNNREPSRLEEHLDTSYTLDGDPYTFSLPVEICQALSVSPWVPHFLPIQQA